MLCANCKHFDQPTQFSAPYGQCTLAASSDNEAVTPNAFAFASDSESWQARLNVLPSFGCNQFVATSVSNSNNPSEHRQREYFTGADKAFRDANNCLIAVTALKAGDWDNPQLVAVGELAPTESERIAQVETFYLSR